MQRESKDWESLSSKTIEKETLAWYKVKKNWPGLMNTRKR